MSAPERTPPRPPARGRRAAVLTGAVLLTVVAQFTLVLPAAPAFADDTPPAPPGAAQTSPPPEVDSNAPGLKLRAGATLAPARVLDLVSVVETQGGEERRSDTPDSVTFALQAEVLFSKDSAKLSPDASSRISAIADEVEKQHATNLRVFGFTDNLGTAAHGLVLSKQRAEAVHSLLEQRLSDAGITYEIRGYGEQYPIADNSTEDGRKKNRRVEVSFPRTDGGKSDTGDTGDTGDTNGS
ncbi:OmpA family protein [Streptomyces fuscigenes]|uniref:OmpA family protein n=1 Tax=Streptomyces fuscigenes TaxID=1528880 RepID=UPI001F37BBD5|nr:OmpA family protein [Streptomyces fuscigenes]MCF3962850.1 OmpA family protein [Streptomyces fuscigenes]